MSITNDFDAALGYISSVVKILTPVVREELRLDDLDGDGEEDEVEEDDEETGGNEEDAEDEEDDEDRSTPCRRHRAQDLPSQPALPCR
jgi:hypothetical protein